VAAACFWLAGLSGCASLTFPVTGVPAHRVPPELLGEPVEQTETIDLALLGQPAPDLYRLAPGDVLGIWIDGVLGDRTSTPPVHYSLQQKTPPGLGFPVPIREDGTVSLPLVPPIRLAGLTLAEAEEAVARTYTIERQLLQPGVDRIMVTLIQPRTYHVVVMRQESIGGATLIENNFVRNQKRGTGHELELPAYKNDVLNALAATGGLPGLEALNRIIIHRNMGGRPTATPLYPDAASLAEPRRSIELPLRIPPGQPLPFGPDDVVLYDGDVVFIEARDYEVFYTGGLLPTGEHTLPRDYDLDVVEAVSLVGGTIANGGYSTNSILPTTLVQPGIGGPSPSMALVLRRTADGGQVPIRVNLNRALRDPRERILIQPGDVVLLQQTPGEAFVRYLGETFNFFVDWRVWTRRDSTGVAALAVP